MQTLFLFLAIIVLFYITGKFAGLVIKGAANLGRRLGLSDFVVGFVILGFATSCPEFLVGLNAVIENVPRLSIGNLFGGIIVLFTLVIGFNAVLNNGLEIKGTYTGRQLLITGVVILLPLLLALDNSFSRFDGFLLLLVYAAYLYDAFKERQTKAKTTVLANTLKISHSILFLIAGLLGLVICSKIIVELSQLIALKINWSPLLLGLLLLAVGTNLPEIILSFKSANTKHKNIVLGDLLGSASVNIFLMGLIIILRPIPVIDGQSIIVASLGLICATSLLLFFMRTRFRLSKLEGSLLMILYIFYLTAELIFNK